MLNCLLSIVGSYFTRKTYIEVNSEDVKPRKKKYIIRSNQLIYSLRILDLKC